MNPALHDPRQHARAGNDLRISTFLQEIFATQCFRSAKKQRPAPLHFLFSFYEYCVAVGWADVLSRVRGCNDAGEPCTRLVREIAGRASGL
jgi:hypothetical protein